MNESCVGCEGLDHIDDGLFAVPVCTITVRQDCEIDDVNKRPSWCPLEDEKEAADAE